MIHNRGMKRSIFLALVAVVSICTASAQNLKSQIMKMNAQVARALQHKDMATFEKITRAAVTSDFKHTEMGHSQDYDTMLSEVKQSMAMIKKFTAVSATTKDVVVHGDKGTSTTVHRMDGVMDGPDKKTHKLVMSGTTKDVYRKEGGKWKLAEMNWVSQKMTLDGKPFNPQAMGGGN